MHATFKYFSESPLKPSHLHPSLNSSQQMNMYCMPSVLHTHVSPYAQWTMNQYCLRFLAFKIWNESAWQTIICVSFKGYFIFLTSLYLLCHYTSISSSVVNEQGIWTMHIHGIKQVYLFEEWPQMAAGPAGRSDPWSEAQTPKQAGWSR